MPKLSSDIFELTTFTNDLARKYMDDVSEETLFMSTFGMIADVSANMLQNAVVVSGELSNEAIPTRAKFDRNVITHALSVGIKDINAKPATMKVIMYFPEKITVANMKNDRVIIDKDIPYYFEDIEFHLDYDLLIYRTKLIDGSYVYSANYFMDGYPNPISKIANPYLPPVGVFKIWEEGDTVSKLQTYIAVMCTLTQVEYREINTKILTDNMIENKTFTFDYDGQMAGFDLIVKDPDGEEKRLTPLYDGLYDDAVKENYFYYTYVDANTVRVKFNKDVYEPRANSNVTVRLYTSRGIEGNFTYKDQIMKGINDTLRYPYNGLYVLIRQRGDDGSVNGENRASTTTLQKKIPKEALARGSVTNSTDLNNYFNQINTENSVLKVFRKRDNQLERLYYTYNLIKDTKNNIVPTNTIDFKVPYSYFVNSYDPDLHKGLVLVPGTKIWYCKGIADKYEGFVDDGEEHEGFSYMCPFTIKVNLNPLYASYYLDIIHSQKDLEFRYINSFSGIQFISDSITVDRNFFTNRDTYQIKINLAQNIHENFNLVVVDPDTGEIDVNKIKVYGLLYRDSKYSRVHRYCVGQLCPEYIGKEGYTDVFVFSMNLETNNSMSDDNELMLTNVYEPGTSTIVPGEFKSTMYMEILMFIETDEYENYRGDYDRYIPGLEGCVLTNTYRVATGVDLFYNYTDTINSAVEYKGVDEDVIDEEGNTVGTIDNDSQGGIFNILKVPLVKYDYINSEERMSFIVREIRTKLEYINECLEQLETSFGVDYKLFNTYGPSIMFYIREEELIDKVNLTMTFDMKLYSSSDKSIVDYIIRDIKEYMEQMDDINDLHMPNLITQITNTYREQLVYFEFVDLNGYGPGEQHIIKDETYETSSKVPEFLNINTLDDDTPDIHINLM